MASHSSWASRLRHHRHAGQVCGCDRGWIDATQPSGVKRRPFARVGKERPQSLGLMAVDLFTGPIQAADVILERGLHGAHMGGAQALISLVGARHSGPGRSGPGSPPRMPPLPSSGRPPPPSLVREGLPGFGCDADRRASGRRVGHVHFGFQPRRRRRLRLRRRLLREVPGPRFAAPRPAPPPRLPPAGRGQPVVSCWARSPTAEPGRAGRRRARSAVAEAASRRLPRLPA